MTPPRQASWGAAPIRRQSFLERRLGLTWAPIGRDFRIGRACTCCTCSPAAPAAPAARCRRLSHKLMPGIRSPQHSTCAKLRVVRTVGAHRTSAQDGMSPGNNKAAAASCTPCVLQENESESDRPHTHTHTETIKKSAREVSGLVSIADSQRSTETMAGFLWRTAASGACAAPASFSIWGTPKLEFAGCRLPGCGRSPRMALHLGARTTASLRVPLTHSHTCTGPVPGSSCIGTTGTCTESASEIKEPSKSRESCDESRQQAPQKCEHSSRCAVCAVCAVVWNGLRLL